ncbi:MAG: HD domain-containing protein, partial [Carnobacterium sp.]
MTLSYDAEQLLPIEQVFRDPVHDYIHIQHQLILDLIDTREFQRLRRIKQLGTASFTFHGAEHSRFTHSLGVYEIARRICDKFARNFPEKTPGDGGWDDSERLVVLCAALLHDIGHGPYSHTFERIFKTDHEAITVEIILSSETEVNKLLKAVANDFPAKVASVIQKTYPNPQVVQLISSQIDADRMDYLLRDAYFTGVNYGTFDLTRILRVIRPYSQGIAFQIAGMHAVEDYIVSRYQMYMQVYFHPVSRSMEVILDH